MTIRTINKKIAVIPPVYEKIEAEIVGGFATISQKTRVVECDLVFSFELPDGTKIYPGKNKVLVSGDAGLQAWSTNILSLDGKEFALLPIEYVIAIIGPDKVVTIDGISSE